MINSTWFKKQSLPGDEIYNDYVVIYSKNNELYGRTVKYCRSGNEAVKKLQEHYKKVNQKIKIHDRFFKKGWKDDRSNLNYDWIDDPYATL